MAGLLDSMGSGRSYMCSGYMYRLNTVKMPTTMFTMINQRVRRLMKLSMCSAVGSRVMKGLSSGCTGYLFRNCLRRWAAYASPKTMPSQSRVLVIMCVSCQLCTLFIFTKHYQEAAPYQTHHVPGVRRRLPTLTGSCARGAKPIGVFGLVYQRLPVSGSGFGPTVCHLYQSLPPRPRTGH